MPQLAGDIWSLKKKEREKFSNKTRISVKTTTKEKIYTIYVYNIFCTSAELPLSSLKNPMVPACDLRLTSARHCDPSAAS